jgi:hypothetical protein
VELGAPSAQASLDTEGNASSFAGLPYPGDTIANISSVPSVLLNTSIPFTPPGYILAETPLTPHAATSDPSGTYELSADADPAVASGHAALDPGAGAISSGIRADSTVTLADDGTMRVVSESVASGLDVGGVLRIGSVRSSSITTYTPGDEAPVTVNDFAIEAFSVLGVPVALGPDGLSLAGQLIPLPLDALVSTLDTALAGAGVRLRMIEEVQTEGGGAAKALEIKVTQTLPLDGDPEATITYRLGGASSFITVAPRLNPAPERPAAPAPPAAAPAVSAPAVGASSFTPPPLAAPSAPIAPAPVASRPLETEPVLLARDLTSAVRGFYLVLVAGGALGVLASALWGWKGGRASWLD